METPEPDPRLGDRLITECGGMDGFIRVMKLGRWICEGTDEHELELTYIDAEIIQLRRVLRKLRTQFRFKEPLGKTTEPSKPV